MIYPSKTFSSDTSVSALSVHTSCPVCGQNLAELGTAELQEAHVKSCLEGPRGGSITEQPVKYLVYKLPTESALIGVECVICLEEFARGTFTHGDNTRKLRKIH